MGLLSVVAIAPADWVVRQVAEPGPPPAGAPAHPGLRALSPAFAWYVLFGAG